MVTVIYKVLWIVDWWWDEGIKRRAVAYLREGRGIKDRTPTFADFTFANRNLLTFAACGFLQLRILLVNLNSHVKLDIFDTTDRKTNEWFMISDPETHF